MIETSPFSAGDAKLPVASTGLAHPRTYYRGTMLIFVNMLAALQLCSADCRSHDLPEQDPGANPEQSCNSCTGFSDWTGDQCEYCAGNGVCSAGWVKPSCSNSHTSGASIYLQWSTSSDCSLFSPSAPDSCVYALDGKCDEPRRCAVGTDITDCPYQHPVGTDGTPISAPPLLGPAEACQLSRNKTCPQAAAATGEVKAWTMIHYFDADNNLEPYKVAAMNRMADIRTSALPSCVMSSGINVVFLMDRCRPGTEGCSDGRACDRFSDDRFCELDGIVDADGNPVNPRFTGAKWLQLLPAGSDGKWLELDADLRPMQAILSASGYGIGYDRGYEDMSDPEPDMSVKDTLRHFVTAAIARFPAERYFLEIADHGGAWMGAESDYDNDPHHDADAGVDGGQIAAHAGAHGPMSLNDMQEALLGALNGAKLDIISFDTCLMADQSTAAALHPVADFLIGSELSSIVMGTMPDPWNHAPPFFDGRPDTAEQFAIAMVDEFIQCGGSQNMQTQSLTDLSRYIPFADCMIDVANELIERLETSGLGDDIVVAAITVINSLRRDYGADLIDGGATTGSNDMADYGADIGAFLQRWIHALNELAQQDAGRVSASASAALDAYQLMIVHERHSFNDLGVYTGMHIFLPGDLATSDGARQMFHIYNATSPVRGDRFDAVWHRFISAYGDAVPGLNQCTARDGECTVHECDCPSGRKLSLFTTTEMECWACEQSSSTSSGGTDCDAESLVDSGHVDKSGGYGNSIDCRWTLKCSDSSLHPTLTFSSFNTENNFDWVNVFDGEDLSNTRLLHYCGNTVIPDAVVGSEAEMMVQFVTDGSVTNDGFAATFSCTDRHSTTGQKAGSNTDAGTISQTESDSFSSTFMLTNQSVSDEGNGNIQMSASCPSITVDARVYGGVIVDLTLLPMGAIFELDTEYGKTTVLDTSTAATCIMWTGSYNADISHASGGSSYVAGIWDGLSQTLSDGGEPYFVYARYAGTLIPWTSAMSSMHGTGAQTFSLQLDVMYYKPELTSIPIDGTDGQFATLQASYTYSKTDGFQLTRQSLSAKFDTMVSEAIPLEAGGKIVPIMYGSPQDPKTGLPVGNPRKFLLTPSMRALDWGPDLQLGRTPVTQDFRNVSAREVLMIEVTGIAGRTNSFAGLFDDGVLTATTSEQTGRVLVDNTPGRQHCVQLLRRPGTCVKSALSKTHAWIKENPHDSSLIIAVLALLTVCGCCLVRKKMYRFANKLGFAEQDLVEYSPMPNATEINPILATTEHHPQPSQQPKPSRESAFKASV